MGKAPPEKWLEYARNDLLWAEGNIREEIWYGACFAAQQAAEKALKAYLEFKEKKVPKIHDLIALVDLCTRYDDTFGQFREECLELTTHYFTTRYPDLMNFVGFTEEKAREAHESAKKIVDFVEEKLKEG